MYKFHKKKTMINYNTTNFSTNNSYVSRKLLQKSKKSIKLNTNDNCTNDKNSKHKNHVINTKIIFKRNKKNTCNEDNTATLIKKINFFSVGDINDIKNNKNCIYPIDRLTSSVNAQNIQRSEKDIREICGKNLEKDDRQEFVGNLSKKIIKVGKNQKMINSNSTIFSYEQKQWSKNKIYKK